MVHCHPLLYIIMWGLDRFGFPKGRDNSIENGSSTSLLSFSSLKCHLKQMKLEEKIIEDRVKYVLFSLITSNFGFSP